jgi:hypothetical protein
MTCIGFAALGVGLSYSPDDDFEYYKWLGPLGAGLIIIGTILLNTLKNQKLKLMVGGPIFIIGFVALAWNLIDADDADPQLIISALIPILVIILGYVSLSICDVEFMEYPHSRVLLPRTEVSTRTIASIIFILGWIIYSFRVNVKGIIMVD